MQGDPANAQQGDEDRSPNSLRQQDQTSEPRQNASPTTSPKEPQTQEDLPFTGFLSRNRDEIELHDPVTKIVYKLDDPTKAQPYLGKQVKVIGKLAMNSNTIQTTSIEALSGRE